MKLLFVDAYIHSHHRKVCILLFPITIHYDLLVLCYKRVYNLNYTVFFTWSPALMSGTDSEVTSASQ
jgi:hypothetical protein